MTGLAEHPAIVNRTGRRPRVSFAYWVRHPWRAWWISRLIREALRWPVVENPNPDPAALSHAERALIRRAQVAQARATEMMVARIERLAASFQDLQAQMKRELQLAQLERRRKINPKVKVKIYTAGPIGRKRAKDIIDECREKIRSDTEKGLTRHLERESTAREVGAVIPLLIDIVALTTVITRFFNITPRNALDKLPETITAIGFALITALVLAYLAHSAGMSAWQIRVTSAGAVDVDGRHEEKVEPGGPGEFPAARSLLFAKLVGLVAVSGTAAVSIATRIMHPTDSVRTGWLGIVIGVMVGLAAFLSPWLIIINRMRAGSLEVQTIEALTDGLTEINDAVARHEKAAAQATERATKVRAAADRSQGAARRSADKLWSTCETILELARSHHRQSGRYAISDTTPVDDGHVSLHMLRDSGAARIDEAMKKFEIADDETSLPMDDLLKNLLNDDEDDEGDRR
jgi:hypothetical protein